jgi:dolichyl-phosphate-mannose-protein mannosyltransferase
VLTHHRKKPGKKDVPATAPAETLQDATRNLPFNDTTLVILVTVLATVVRLWNLNYPDSVVFDEVHFGGFASK